MLVFRRSFSKLAKLNTVVFDGIAICIGVVMICNFFRFILSEAIIEQKIFGILMRIRLDTFGHTNMRCIVCSNIFHTITWVRLSDKENSSSTIAFGVSKPDVPTFASKNNHIHVIANKIANDLVGFYFFTAVLSFGDSFISCFFETLLSFCWVCVSNHF